MRTLTLAENELVLGALRTLRSVLGEPIRELRISAPFVDEDTFELRRRLAINGAVNIDVTVPDSDSGGEG